MAVFPGHPVAVPFGDTIPGVAIPSNLPCSRKWRARGSLMRGEGGRRLRNSARLTACHHFEGHRPDMRMSTAWKAWRPSPWFRCRAAGASSLIANHLGHHLSISVLSQLACKAWASMVPLT